jgi:light-harvesting complex 1 beta chain
MTHEISEQTADAGDGTLSGSYSIFFAIFLAFLVMVLFSLLFGQNWRTLLPGAEGARSVFGGVKSAVYTVMSELV